MLVPDGLLHPKFAKRVYGRGHYLTCWKEALQVVIDKGGFFIVIQWAMCNRGFDRIVQKARSKSFRTFALVRASIPSASATRFTRARGACRESGGCTAGIYQRSRSAATYTLGMAELERDWKDSLGRCGMCPRRSALEQKRSFEREASA